jgi:PKD repeat protein
MKTKLLLLFIFGFAAINLLLAGTPRGYVQKCVLDNGEMPPVNNTGTTSNPDYIVRATILETGETLGTDLGSPTPTIRIFKSGNGTSVPFYTATWVNLGGFPTQWQAGQTLRMYVQYIPTAQEATWDIIIPAGTTTINIQNPAQVIPPYTASLIPSNPSPADGSLVQILAGDTVNLSWSGASAAEAYKLYWNGADEYIDLAEPAWTTGPLTSGTYTWQVVPYNSEEEGMNCPIWTFNVEAIDLRPAQSPNPENGGEIIRTADSGLSLSWSPPTEGVIPEGYSLEWNESGELIALGDSFSYDLLGLAPGEYRWRIVPHYQTVVLEDAPVWSFSYLGPSASIDFDPDFGNVWVEHSVSRPLIIHNPGNAALDVTLLLGAGLFTLNPPAGSYEIEAGATMEFSVGFSPTNLGAYSRNLYIETSDPTASLQILTLSGNGYELSADFTVSPASGYFPLDLLIAPMLDAPNIHYTWDFDNGEVYSGEGPWAEFGYTYNNPGIYEISLTVEDAWGFSQQSSQTVEVLTWAEVVSDLESVQFSGTYIGDSSQSLLQLSNAGPGDLSIISIALQNGDGPFELLTTDFPAVLVYDNMSVLSLEISFTPQSVGVFIDSLIVITDSREHARLAIPVVAQGLYAPPKAPQNVALSIDGVDAVVNWDAVTQNIMDAPVTVPYYFVYGAMDPAAGPEGQFFLGYSTNTNFRHMGVGLPGGNIQPPAQYFYTVSAVVLYSARLDLVSLNNLVGKASRRQIEEFIR